MAKTEKYPKPVIGERHPDGRAWNACTMGEVELLVAIPFLQWATQKTCDDGTAEATGAAVTALVFDELTPIAREVLAASLANLAVGAGGLAQMVAAVVYTDRKLSRFNN